MTSKQILDELKKAGTENIKKILLNHGIAEPVYGAKVSDLKVYQKKIKRDQPLAMELFASGVYEGMYLAGLIADESKMSKKDIQGWAEKASCDAINEYTVAWVAAESEYGWELGMKWIDSPKERIASGGWNTLSGVASMKDDKDLDIETLKKLLKRVEKEIHTAPNRVRYAMNNYVISIGSYVKELTPLANEVGKNIGNVTVDMGNTACKVPFAPEYIKKVKDKGNWGKKKKTVKC